MSRQQLPALVEPIEPSPPPRSGDPDQARVQQLEAELRRARAEAKANREEREQRKRTEQQAVGELDALADRALRQPLDAVLAEMRKALPGCERWHGRAVAALRDYEREAGPLLERAGLARGSAYRVERLSAGHPLLPLLSWLALLAGHANDPTEAA